MHKYEQKSTEFQNKAPDKQIQYRGQVAELDLWASPAKRYWGGETI